MRILAHIHTELWRTDFNRFTTNSQSTAIQLGEGLRRMLPWRIQTHARELVGKYLAWHYNHGSKVVGINVGTSDQSLMSHLSKALLVRKRWLLTENSWAVKN